MKEIVLITAIFLFASSLKRVIDDKALLYHNDRSIEYVTDFLAIAKHFKKVIKKLKVDQMLDRLIVSNDDYWIFGG
jgi:hypothetical protein